MQIHEYNLFSVYYVQAYYTLRLIGSPFVTMLVTTITTLYDLTI